MFFFFFFSLFYTSLFDAQPFAMSVPPRLLLEREKDDLLVELRSLPNNAVIRRINELVKRARSVKVHAYIIHYLRKQARVLKPLNYVYIGCSAHSIICMVIHYYTALNEQMPYTWGKQEKQEKLLSNLNVEFLGCARR